MKIRRSIPAFASERTVRPFRRTGDAFSGGIWFREVECRVKGKVVGTRSYDDKDQLMIETPMRGKKVHGVRLEWDENGDLELAEPYHNGMVSGTSRQYHKGKLVGTYSIRNGTGLDVWRNQREDGTWFVSEIWPLRNGHADGIELWFNEDERTVWREAYWRASVLHGIEREWNARGRLARGYPRYWTNGSRVTKQAYLAACKRDSSLPLFQLRDQKPARSITDALHQQSADRQQHRELNRRVRAYRQRKAQGKASCSSWAEVKRRIRSRRK
jgi:hypothetical protein